jgi:hypothetical protein
MKSLPTLGACIIALSVSGCTTRDTSASDSARMADSVSAVESFEAAPEQAPPILIDSASQGTPPPADASGNLTGETTKKGGTLGQDPPRRDTIGRDSAFGPIGTMDSDGTVRPIRK